MGKRKGGGRKGRQEGGSEGEREREGGRFSMEVFQRNGKKG